MTHDPAPHLDAAASDRAAGVLLAQACGDALGAPYEFGQPLPGDAPVSMKGGGPFGWAPAEWTDDTSMSIPLLDAAERARREGNDLLEHLDAVAVAWHAWAQDANDVGNQTRAALTAAARPGPVTADALTAAARDRHDRVGRSGGNGSLMRTAPLALAYLDDEASLGVAARRVSDLTHPDPDAGDACVLWCAAIRHAVLTGTLNPSIGLRLLPADRSALWHARLLEAETHPPTHFDHNGWVVHALQAAWSAIHHTPVPGLDPAHDSYPAQHLLHALETVVRAGGDTDTVAAIAGALLGATWGASAVPAEWRRRVHGWPGLTGTNLANRGLAVAQRTADGAGWPLTARVDYTGYGAVGRLVEHPHDPGVLLGDVAVLDRLPAAVDAVVSLCRVGTHQPVGIASSDRVPVWLIDTSDPAANPNLDFVLADTAETIHSLRREGRTVLLHCVAAQSRTPTVAAVYAARHLGIDPALALDQITAALPNAHPNAAFRAALSSLPARSVTHDVGGAR